MKIQIYFGLCLLLGASSFSVRADDNPAQAAARAALVKMLMESSPPPTPPSPPAPSSNTSWAVAQPGETIVVRTNTTQAKVVLAPPGGLTATSMVDVPVAPAPVVIPPAAPVITIQPQAPVPPLMPKPAMAVTVVKAPSPPPAPKPASEIVTIYGTVYKNAQVEKVDRDGIIISYSTAGGGLGMSKVDFKDLPYEFRQQYQRY
jgi:hypothetical protein